jgi:hypothetical protein
MAHRLVFRAIAVALVLSWWPIAHAAAWGDLGHRVVALIAAERLNDNARRAVEDLLGAPVAPAMADAATWADEIKSQRPDTRPWHYVDIPIDDLAYRADLCRQDACVVAQVDRDLKILADKSLLKSVRAEALRFLIHFIGDEHQPLHCGENHDRGGNEVKVRLNGRNTNLHAVWDTDVVRGLGIADADRLAVSLAEKINEADAKAWAKGTPTSWCVETAGVAKSVVYAALPGTYRTDAPVLLTADYLSDNAAVASRQLQRAGVRLATLLNKTL